MITRGRQYPVSERKPLAAEQKEVGKDEILDRVENLAVAGVRIVDAELSLSRLAGHLGA
jgi:hypothetical protein